MPFTLGAVALIVVLVWMVLYLDNETVGFLCDCEDQCLCTMSYDPVCGVDQNTYNNSCSARCLSNVEVACDGECPCEIEESFHPDCEDQSVCTTLYDPVCGVDGETYPNSCSARCLSSIEVACDGECPCEKGEESFLCDCEDQCGCTLLYDPVCGVDGETYSNACSARCWSNVEVACDGECPCEASEEDKENFLCDCEDQCSCITLYEPVCGVDETTYSNTCSAKCLSNVEVACDGECPCETDEEIFLCDCEDQCSCITLYVPVCGVDGETYSNTCSARCQSNVEVACDGECPCETDEEIFLCPCEDQCTCIEVYDPVCGVDKTTYSNTCTANCLSNVEVACDGECPCETAEEIFLCDCEDECVCIASYEPVCGVDKTTYSNTCSARCLSNIEVACDGECPCETDEEIFLCDCLDECVCTAIYDPVCGLDEKTYSSTCSAECLNNVEVACEGECPC